MSIAPTPSLNAANVADFTIEFNTHGLEKQPGELSVTGFTGAEPLSELFSFRVEMCSRDDEIDVRRMLGRGATLTIAGAKAIPEAGSFTIESGDDAGSRSVHGIVKRFERIGQGSHVTNYACELVPRHWLLTKRQRSRIFQRHNCADMSAAGIIGKVLDEAALGQHKFVLEPSRTYEQREFVVQYRESDWDFVSRLMEEEGFYYFFKHEPAGVLLIITDGAYLGAQRDLPFRERNELVREREFVYSFKLHEEIQFGSVCLDDFDFKRPSVELAARTNFVTGFSGLELTDFPGEFIDRPVGERLAQVRLEEHQCRRDTRTLHTTVRNLRPADRLEIDDAPVNPFDRKLFITRIEHRASQPQSAEDELLFVAPADYEAVVSAIPDHPATRFRPARKTPRPIIAGAQTAIVVGPLKEDIYTDAYGRVKVQFHWDPDQRFDEHSSCFIRVSQGMAGGMYGMMFLPRVGQEVIVSFLEGDPDRPIITGRVYNNDHMPPYQLPAEKTKSCIKTHSTKNGGGCNEIRFDDAKGSEQLFIQAERNMEQLVKSDHVHTVAGSYHLNVGNGESGDLLEYVHGCKETRIVGNRDTLIEGGDYRVVFGNTNTQIRGHAEQVAAGDLRFGAINQRIGCKDNYTLTANAIQLTAQTILELNCGSTSIVLTPDAIYINGGPKVFINSGSVPSFDWEPRRAEDPIEPYEPAVARRSEPGRDFRYGPAPEPVEPPLADFPLPPEPSDVPLPPEPSDVPLPPEPTDEGQDGPIPRRRGPRVTLGEGHIVGDVDVFIPGMHEPSPSDPDFDAIMRELHPEQSGPTQSPPAGQGADGGLPADA